MFEIVFSLIVDDNNICPW